MSGTFAAIFSFEASKKWIIREGGKGISRTGSGAPRARGLKKSLGALIGREGYTAPNSRRADSWSKKVWIRTILPSRNV
jgi:hypothetical protein